MFAIVEIAGKQYHVAKGDTVMVSKLDAKAGDALTFDRVLLVNDGKSTQIGTPTVAGVKVKAKILSQERGEKLKVGRYKSKVRYRKTTGFRAMLTKIEIVAVG